MAIAFPATIILRKIYWFMYRKYHSLPPGPNGLPFIGMAIEWHSSTQNRINLSKKYGEIFYTFYVGSPCIVLSSSKLVKQLLTQKEFLNRGFEGPYHPNVVHQPSIFTFGKSQALAIGFVDGDPWKKRRKISQNALFKILNGEELSNLLKETFERDVSKYFDEIIKSNNGKWGNSREIFQFITLNTIYSAVFSQSIERNSIEFKKLQNNITKTMQSLVIDRFVITFSVMKYLFGPKILKYRKERDDQLLTLINDKIKDKKDEEKDKSYIDYMHELLTNGELTQDEELADLFNLFIAGMDTTTNTLEIGITLLAKYEDIQEKIRKELVNIMGNGYNMSLVNKCPLLRAAIHEMLRISSTTFMGGAHVCFTDYWITLDDGRKYKIPKNCPVFQNLDYIDIYGKGKDENWKTTDGDKLVLENWLIEDEDGGIGFKINKSFISFGVGKRDCIGRHLSIKEMCYTFGYLLMNYKFSYWNDDDRNKDIILMRDSSSLNAYLNPAISIKIERI